MPLLFQKIIKRADVEMNPHVQYCFGDNDKRQGMGGQAAEMRGSPNTHGIRTKKSPSMDPHAFYTDDEYDENVAKIDADFSAIATLLEEGNIVVFPTDGFGTGMARLAETAPRTFAYIRKLEEELAVQYA